MQTGKRVYPRQREPGKWVSYLLLFLSAVVVLSGLVSRGGDLTIQPVPTATPIPTDAYFDETVEEREITLPSATVTDNMPAGCVLYVCYVAPDGTYSEAVDFQMRCTQEGVYRVKYMAMDDYGNTTVLVYDIEVN